MLGGHEASAAGSQPAGSTAGDVEFDAPTASHGTTMPSQIRQRWQARKNPGPTSERDPSVPVWPRIPPHAYLGQLEPEFQHKLAELLTPESLDDCDFYHAIALPDGRVIDGAWDLRGGESEYLGATDFTSRRVLECGPATGHLTFHMERSGAEVVVLEPGFDVPVDILPGLGRDLAEERTRAMWSTARVHHSWWYVHSHFGSSAKAVYASIYNVPGDLGEFDVAVFGAVLLHIANPFLALQQAANRTRHRVVVTDLMPESDVDPEQNFMIFAPWGSENLTHWWYLSPGALIRMLEVLGFTRTSVQYHTQRHHPGHNLAEPPIDVPMFTVVGDRP